MILPSKELLSEVLELKYPIRIIHHFCKGQNVLNYDLHVECALFEESINIYELAHKCKEWATYNGYFLYPARNFESFAIKFGCSIMKPHYKYGNFYCLLSIDGFDEREYLTDTEVEAIFKACEWLLKEMK